MDMIAFLALQLLLSEPVPLHEWLPHPPPPTELLVVPFEGDTRRGLLLESLAGLAERHALDHGPGTMLWEKLDNTDYARWLQAFRAAHQPKCTDVTLEAALRELVALGMVKGYLLYHFDGSNRPLHTLGPHDESANVATSLAGVLGGVAVAEELEPMAQAAGLKLLVDCRTLSESDCLARYGDAFAKAAVGTGEPRTRNARSLMIAHRLFVSSGTGEAYPRSLARCEPDSPVIGWGIAPEDQQTLASSRAGLFQTATNWCHNLPVLSSERPGRDIPWSSLHVAEPSRPSLQPERGKHYVCLTLTDGDNIQWMMGNFMGGSEGHYYYGHPRRGEIPFTWGVPAEGLLELSPRTLSDILTTARPKDDFVLYSGGGYFYPDLYGSARVEDCVALHARRLRPVMERTGIRVLAFNFQHWDSDAALRACAAMARQMPGLLGILAFQYYPYSAGDGAIHWVDGADGDRVPVVSCRYTVWAKTGRPADTTPSRVAALLNGLPTVGDTASAADFSWVLVHAWSRFRAPKAGVLRDDEDEVPQDSDQGGSRGYDAAPWTAQRLDPHVVPVGAAELLELIRAGAAPAAGR
jgi:hypothetical protein